MLADSDEQLFEFLNIVDLATCSNMCFPVPSKRPDDVLSVLEMVWINWAGPMNHLISDMEGEFEGGLGEFMEAHGIRQHREVALFRRFGPQKKGGVALLRRANF